MIKSNQFRKELQKIMPGYKWTVHRSIKYGLGKPSHITAKTFKKAVVCD